ncbi:dynamin family protein [Neisseria elongata]|uniref:dynamin family protein n=1 Tax=Neisseria elongata TaxID=495 RepID=UPI000D39C0C0|nr:dynamin family protein [Neisseria elongata]
MKAKKNFLEYIKKVKNIITPLEIPDNGLSDIQSQIEYAELIVPVVGGFSAGKSTLINSFLGTEILPTAVTPETALATELRYSETDYIEAVTESGSIERHEISEFGSLKDNARNFTNLRLFLNNDKLKVIQPLVLVDMPGFDAPIENHNRAILTYLERGVFFVFLTSVDDGNITLSMKREIENLERFSKGFAFCISKTNLRAPDDVAAVKEKIADQLADYFDYEGEIALLDMDGGENLNKILQTIDPEELFSSLFLDTLRDNNVALTQSINLKTATLKKDGREAEDTVSALQDALNKLDAQKNNALSEIEHRYSGSRINAIAEKVAQVLLMKKAHLVELGMQNQHAFANELNELVKNSLLSQVQSSFQDVGAQIVRDFDSEMRMALSGAGSSSLLDDNMISRIADSTERLLGSFASGLSNMSAGMNERVRGGNGGSIGALYRTAATILGLTTSVVAPVLEVVIVFLPDIIRYFSKGAQERKMREQIEQKITGEIIPDVKAKIRESLPRVFNEQVERLIMQISHQFEGQLQQKRDEIKATEAEKAAKAAELEEVVAGLEEGRRKLNEAAQQYLFA